MRSGWNGWCEHRMPQGYTYYNNYITKDTRWSTPPDFQVGIGHLNRDEVQVRFLLFIEKSNIIVISS